MSRLGRAKLAIDALRSGRPGDFALLKADLLGARASEEAAAKLCDVISYRPKIDLTELAKLPSDTFGKHYATWMTSKKLRPFVISENLSEIADRNTFAVRYAVTHDMLHVLTGFDTSYAGEIGVLSFAVAQNYSPKLEASLKLASVLYPILSLGRFNAIANAKRRGTRFGKEADCLIGLRLEDHFGENLDALRASLGLCLNQNDTSPKKFGARRIRPSK